MSLHAEHLQLYFLTDFAFTAHSVRIQNPKNFSTIFRKTCRKNLLTMTLKYGYSNTDICGNFCSSLLPKLLGEIPGSIPRYSLTNHYENPHFFEKFEKFESASDGLPICRKVMPINSGFASGFSKNSKK